MIIQACKWSNITTGFVFVSCVLRIIPGITCAVFWLCLMKFYCLLQHPNEMLAYSVLNPHERNIYILKCKFIVSRARLVSAAVSRRVRRKMDSLKFQTILLETRHYHPGCPTIIKPASPCIFPVFFFSLPRCESREGGNWQLLRVGCKVGDELLNYFSYGARVSQSGRPFLLPFFSFVSPRLAFILGI